MFSRSFLRWVGFAMWVGLLGVALSAATSHRAAQSTNSSSTVLSFLLHSQRTIRLQSEARDLKPATPVFFQDSFGDWLQVGFVKECSDGTTPKVVLSWYSTAIKPEQCQFTLYRNRGRLEDVVTTMLPPEKRLQIQQRLASVVNQYGEELSAAFVPLVQASVQRSMPVIEDEFRRAVARHRDEIEELGQRWNDEVVSERLIPLARREILPIVRERGEPTVEEIGRELWDRASIWRFGWRAVYDRSPLPRKDLLQEEWDRFVDQEAVPVFEQHMDEIVTAIQGIVADVAANQTVRSELGTVAASIASDAETQRLVRQILEETLIENQRLRDVWNEVWSSEEARTALNLAGDRFEPVIRQIGDDLFGSRDEGINPNFARVLRNQILGKDRQWIVAKLQPALESNEGTKVLNVTNDSMPYPIVYLADRDDQNRLSVPERSANRVQNANSVLGGPQ